MAALKDYIISIDMGGTKILSALLNSNDGIILRTKKSTKKSTGKPDYVPPLFESVQALIKEAKIHQKQVKAICLGVPGSVNPETGVIGLAPNLGIKNYHIQEAFQKYTPIPVLIENDVNLAALGILHFGLAKGKKNVLVVFIGTGIGGGLIIDGKLYRGSGFVAGEIGHMKIAEKGPLCGCGQRACFEAFASRTAIVRDLSAAIRKGSRSKLAELVKSKTQIKSKSILNALEAQDALVWKHITKQSQVIGSTLASINNLLNLEMIVLGGGVIEAMHKYMIPMIRSSFKQASLKDASRHTKLVASRLLDDAALFGGIPLAEEFLGVKV